MNLNDSLEKYINELSSGSPTPGGGNVSALCGVLAASLGQMVCSLTIGKKKYAEVEDEIKNVREKLNGLSKEFIALAEKDNEAFEKVMKAFKLPKDTEVQKQERAAAIDSATMEAAIVPSEVISKCKQLIPYLETTASKGNRNSISDAGVALSLTSASAEGAFLNVAINCAGLTNRVAADKFLQEAEATYIEVKEKTKTLTENLIKDLSGK